MPEEVKLGKEEETPVAMPEVAKPEVEKAPEKVLGEQQMTRFYALPRLASSVVEVGGHGKQASKQASAVAMCS